MASYADTCKLTTVVTKCTPIISFIAWKIFQDPSTFIFSNPIDNNQIVSVEAKDTLHIESQIQEYMHEYVHIHIHKVHIQHTQKQDRGRMLMLMVDMYLIWANE